MHRTSYIVLRKTPFQESGLVVAGLSPDFGRLDFLVKGARTISKRKFPVLELFRELSIEFREPHGHGLLSMRSVEPMASFDSLAKFPESYLAACSYAAFLLKHGKPMLECPMAYQSFKTALGRLCEGATPGRALMLARLGFMHESGFLPERLSGAPDDSEEERRHALVERLLDSALGSSEPPPLSDAYWSRLSSWLDSLVSYHSLD